MDADLLPLSEVVRVLRAELAEAIREGQGEAVRFELGPVELEVNVVVARERAGKMETSFKILGWGAGGDVGAKWTDQRVQKLKIVLNPTDRLGGR